LNDRKDKTPESDSDSRIGIKKLRTEETEDGLNNWDI
jgi:hypothetical protein